MAQETVNDNTAKLVMLAWQLLNYALEAGVPFDEADNIAVDTLVKIHSYPEARPLDAQQILLALSYLSGMKVE